MPFIFLCNIVLALFSFYFYILWFLIMAVTYVITLGGIRWQPFVTEAEYDGEFNYGTAPDKKKANIITLIPFLCVALVVIIVICAIILSALVPVVTNIGNELNFNLRSPYLTIMTIINVIFGIVSAILGIIFFAVIFVVIPVMFKLVPAEEKAEIEAPAEEKAEIEAPAEEATTV